MTGPGRSISDDIEATIGQLNELHAAGRARRVDMLAQLRGVVARLDDAGLPDEPEPEIERPARGDERRERQPGERLELDRREPAPGDFGPRVRAKLRRMTAEDGGW